MPAWRRSPWLPRGFGPCERKGPPISGTRETWLARFVAAFAIPHPPSAICHLPSVICHFSFPIPRSEFRIFSRAEGASHFWHKGNVVGLFRLPVHFSPATCHYHPLSTAKNGFVCLPYSALVRPKLQSAND